MTVEQIAKVCHEANRAYCEVGGDQVQAHWEEAPKEQRESVIKGVRFYLGAPMAMPSDMHDAWVKDKRKQGWVYGSARDDEKKIHPCLMPYDRLPIEQRAKDKLFMGVVQALRSLLTKE